MLFKIIATAIRVCPKWCGGRGSICSDYTSGDNDSGGGDDGSGISGGRDGKRLLHSNTDKHSI